MSRRKQSRPVKVLEDGSEEECTSGVSLGEPGAAVVVNGHHVSTSTRRFDDGATSMTSDDEDDEENGPMHGEKLPRKLSNTCRQCAMGFLSFSELSEHNKTCVLRTGSANNAATSDDFDHRHDHDDTDDIEDDEEADDDEHVVDDLDDLDEMDDYHRHGHHYNAAGLQAMAVDDLRSGRHNNSINNNNNNNNNHNNNKAHEEQRRQRQDAENNNRRYGGGLSDSAVGAEDIVAGGGMIAADDASPLVPAVFPYAAAYQAAVQAVAAAADVPALQQQQQQQAAAGHVTLEALQHTKVAVAQFAATAMANNGAVVNPNVLQDLALVNSSLYTLQHQQMMQLSLIQQLRQQLQISRGGTGSIDDTLSVSPPLIIESNDDSVSLMQALKDPTPAHNLSMSILALTRNNAKMFQHIAHHQHQAGRSPPLPPPPPQQLLPAVTPLSIPLPVSMSMSTNQSTGDCTTQTPLLQLSRSPSPSTSRSPTPPPASIMAIMLPELQRPAPSPLQALQASVLPVQTPPPQQQLPLQPNTIQPMALVSAENAPQPLPTAPLQSQSQPSTSSSTSFSLTPYTSSPIVTHHHSIPSCSVSSAFASSIITNLDPPPSPSEPNSLEMLQRRAQEVLDKASQGMLANNLADELSFRKCSGSGGKGSSLSPYDGKSAGGSGGSRGDNFYKHRCRYCGKVFGSDSALQIHIRSHTGERPFKCNVCGSRFTTKGNLKVHFQRHTSKFPNVKMNPLPVPEHLDRDFPALMPPHLNQSPHHQNGCSSQMPPNSTGAVAPRSPLSHQFSAVSSASSFPTALTNLFRTSGSHHGQHQQHQSSSTDIALPSNIQMPLQQQQQPAEQLLMTNHHQQLHHQQQQQQQHNIHQHHHKHQQQHHLANNHSSSLQLFQFKREQEQPENLSKPANAGCSSRESSIPSPAPLSDSSMTRNNKDDPTSSEYIDDMAVDIDSADVDERQHDIDANTDDFSVDTKYSGEEERTNSPPMNDGLQDQPENLSNKSGRVMMASPPLITSDESFSPRPTSSSSRHHGSRAGSPASMSFNNSRYSPPCALDLTPKQPALAPSANHIINAYLPPAFAGLMAGAAPPAPVIQNHGPSFGQSPARGNTTCNICFKTFACHSALEIHYRSHTKERPFKCSVCDRGFSTKGNMKQHMLTHKTRDMSSTGAGGGSSSNNMFDGNNSTSCGHDDTASNASSESREAAQHHLHHQQHHQQQIQQQMALINAATQNVATVVAAVTGTATGGVGSRSLPPPPPPPLPLPPQPSQQVVLQQPPNGMMPAVTGTATATVVSANASTCTGSSSTSTAVQSAADLSPPPAQQQQQQQAPSQPLSAKSSIQPVVTLSVPTVGQPQQYNAPGSGSRKPPATTEGGLCSSSSSSPKRSLADPEAGLPSAKRQQSSAKHLCNVCNKNFSSSSALQIHMRTHTGDKPFRCTVCMKAFTTKGNLKVHMGTHMWTNGTSRRGRRMSLELPPLQIANTVKETDFLQRRPEIYYHPFLQPGPFLNGIHQQKINEISVIQNVNSNVNNRILSGFGNFGGGVTFPGDMMKQEPSIATDKQNHVMSSSSSPPSHHIRTPPLWDLHYDRQTAVNIKSAEDHQLNNCAPQSPQSSPIAHTNHISQNRTEGLAT
ncbi:sal-like protein 3 isoform X1 [Myzus persicae]|uniref:sal-like protein 3 isoform X1 n=1 Tax=Myzus persicae TaxID=13164 RepID=UPI000B93259F|nr:sal-like protein 3 isoform X1 [Myzus persicae]